LLSSVFENLFSQRFSTPPSPPITSALRLLSAAKRRDFDLLSHHRQVLLKNSFELLSAPSDSNSPAGHFRPLRQHLAASFNSALSSAKPTTVAQEFRAAQEGGGVFPEKPGRT
jgi:hypothetical protein